MFKTARYAEKVNDLVSQLPKSFSKKALDFYEVNKTRHPYAEWQWNDGLFLSSGEGDSHLTVKVDWAVPFSVRIYAWIDIQIGKYIARMITFEKKIDFDTLSLECLGALSHNIVAKIQTTQLQGILLTNQAILDLVNDMKSKELIPKMSYRMLLEKYSHPVLNGMPEESLYSVLGTFLVSTRNNLMSQVAKKHIAFFRYLLQYAHEKNSPKAQDSHKKRGKVKTKKQEDDGSDEGIQPTKNKLPKRVSHVRRVSVVKGNSGSSQSTKREKSIKHGNMASSKHGRTQLDSRKPSGSKR